MRADTCDGPPVLVIDLGTVRGEPDDYAAPNRSTVPAWFAPLLVVVLVLLGTAASAAPPPPPLSPVLTLPVGATDSFALVDGGVLLTQTRGELSAYDLDGGRMQWSTGATTPAYRLRTGGGLVLLRPWSVGRADPGTTAVALTDGTLRWRRDDTVVTVPGSPALLAVGGLRSVYGAGRRVEGSVAGVDPVTGRTRWRVDVPSSAVLLGVPGPAGSPARMLLVHDGRRADLHDLTTGRRLTGVDVPPADYGPENPAVVGGTLLLRHVVTGGSATPGPAASRAGRPAVTDGPAALAAADGSAVSGYDPVTLQRRWTRPARSVYDIEPCGAWACLTGPGGVRAVDPRDGTLIWYRPGWRSVEQRGGQLLAFTPPSADGDLVGVVDPRTGDVVADLRGWRPVAGTGGEHLLVSRVVEAGARTLLAVAGPAAGPPLPLADLPAGTGDCQGTARRLVCRTADGELVVWAYRPRG